MIPRALPTAASLIAAAAIVASLPGAVAPPPARPAATPGAHAYMREGFIGKFTGRPAPTFALKDLQGRTASLSSYRGRIVLLNFWYSTCFPCRKETPDLIALRAVYKDRGLEILGINLDSILIPQSGGAELQIFLKSFPVPYPILIADQRVFDAYGGIPVQPISFLVDRAGTIAKVFWGAFPGAAYDRAIRPLLGAPAAGPAARPAPPSGP
jgi:peroxiredoxin